MLKRKYGERHDWTRIVKREFAQSYIKSESYQGYVTLLHTVEVTEPLFVTYGDERICIVNDGYMWLQQFPEGKHHAVTVMFNEKGEVVQWYIDISRENGIHDGKPWMDDLFLDLIVLPSGKLIEKDSDELEAAFQKGIIDDQLYHLAWKELKKVKQDIQSEQFGLLNLAQAHREKLSQELAGQCHSFKD
ncbi:DUF402 domain-containing protein [Jeotgalibacillus aurantiacus]|uniref:DUF402 domain-containing protein n=1 Tax=Jeotgalibacillus aurantiacus TaxID=2763266 RepID=UPI001D09E7A0|nr:DUF402 domain-containing protein [Jeotgalibacillus aurantiacus]